MSRAYEPVGDEDAWMASQRRGPDYLSDVYSKMFQEIREQADRQPDLNVRAKAKMAIQGEENAIKTTLASTEGPISMKFLATSVLMKDALKPLIETTPLPQLTDVSGQPISDQSASAAPTGMSRGVKFAIGGIILIVIVINSYSILLMIRL